MERDSIQRDSRDERMRLIRIFVLQIKEELSRKDGEDYSGYQIDRGRLQTKLEDEFSPTWGE
jgi:hypothetical protein